MFFFDMHLHILWFIEVKEGTIQWTLTSHRWTFVRLVISALYPTYQTSITFSGIYLLIFLYTCVGPDTVHSLSSRVIIPHAKKHVNSKKLWSGDFVLPSYSDYVLDWFTPIGCPSGPKTRESGDGALWDSWQSGIHARHQSDALGRRCMIRWIVWQKCAELLSWFFPH